MKPILFVAGLLCLLGSSANAQVAIGTLSSGVTAVTLTIPYTQNSHAYRPGATITIDQEDMYVCSSTATTITICASSRGANNTAAASHASGATVYTGPEVLSSPPGVTPPSVSMNTRRSPILGW